MTIKGKSMGFQFSPVDCVFVVPAFGLQSWKHRAVFSRKFSLSTPQSILMVLRTSLRSTAILSTPLKRFSLTLLRWRHEISLKLVNCEFTAGQNRQA